MFFFNSQAIQSKTRMLTILLDSNSKLRDPMYSIGFLNNANGDRCILPTWMVWRIVVITVKCTYKYSPIRCDLSHLSRLCLPWWDLLRWALAVLNDVNRLIVRRCVSPIVDERSHHPISSSVSPTPRCNQFTGEPPDLSFRSHLCFRPRKTICRSVTSQ